ncbi:hypothetical protein HRG_006861 [Hirsutella rhossiliensis]|uniref:Uncharacterized protein n=1 Tax=Hirsutella rhossiliensis TaxID=111463 RepID=A0A9P8MWZ9_9HYPO|nr:uncharacterized protein HRG_06861 [Hirsutella rhossiliensis]KAH0961781.1 hypothetical protein HRG_06861 [Hirsutella rhossiliensis]
MPPSGATALRPWPSRARHSWPPEAVREFEELEQKYCQLLVKVNTLQGEKDQVTDVDISERLSKLQIAIHTWIQTTLPHLRQDGCSVSEACQRAGRGRKAQSRVEHLLFPKSQSKQSGTTREVGGWAKWLNNHGTCAHVILSLAIWKTLEREIFGLFPRSIGSPIELTSDAEAAVDLPIHASKVDGDDGGGVANHKNKIAVSANKRRAERGAISWRVPEIKHRKEKDLRTIISDLTSSLEKWFHLWLGSSASFSRSADHLAGLGGLVLFAAELQQDMASSRFRYEINRPKFDPGDLPKIADNLLHWDLMDVTQWCLLSPHDGIKGLFHCLYPGFIRFSAEKKKPVSVVRPVVLVYDDLNPHKSPTSRSPSRRSSSTRAITVTP